MAEPKKHQSCARRRPAPSFPPVELVFLNADTVFPNNEALPLIVYAQAVGSEVGDMAAYFRRLFTGHGWAGCWVNGIDDFRHYHSTSHEVLGMSQGSGRVRFGGPEGYELEVQAGVAHKRLDASNDFEVVGAYPKGQKPDMCYGRVDERPAADARVRAVGLPHQDPVHGRMGPMTSFWSATY
jgi:uncharacterized protein YjlB